MELSDNDIRLIALQVSEKLGPNAGVDDIRNLVGEIVGRLHSHAVPPPGQDAEAGVQRRLVVNALGPHMVDVPAKIRQFAAVNGIRLADMVMTKVDKFMGIIAIIQWGDYGGQLADLKYELSRTFEEAGFKAIILDAESHGR